MVNDKDELDSCRYFLEEAHRRCGNLAKHADSPLAKAFGRESYDELTKLLRTLGRTEEDLDKPPEPVLPGLLHSAKPTEKKYHCHSVTGE